MQEVTLHDKTFVKFISEEEVMKAIGVLSAELTSVYLDMSPLFIVVLNGGFMFASDLMKQVPFACEIQFVKVSSYENTCSTGMVTEVIGVKDSMIAERDIVILEDIVDTGNTVEYLYRYLNLKNPKSISVAALLFKPDAYKKDIEIAFKAIEIPNDFVVGYGLDYNQLGRNLRHIYKLK